MIAPDKTDMDHDRRHQDRLFQYLFAFHKLIAIFATHKPRGGLAQLARALAWQARGQRFDSAILHPDEAFRLSSKGFFC